MSFVFFGTPQFAATHLDLLLQAGIKPLAVVTQPDRAAGRGLKLRASAVKQLAEKNGIDVLQPPKITNQEVKQIAKLQVDLFLVVAFGQLLPAALLAIPRYGCINVHPSLLPAWRGAAPIQRAMLAGDSYSGVSLILLNQQLDAGDIVYQCRLKINPRQSASQLQKQLANLGGCMLVRLFKDIPQSLAARPQDDTQACYAHKINKDEARINWDLPAEAILKMVLAFNDFPVAYCYYKDLRIKIWQAKPTQDLTISACSGQAVWSGNKLLVQCAVGVLQILELQLPGKRRVAVGELSKHALFNNLARFN